MAELGFELKVSRVRLALNLLHYPFKLIVFCFVLPLVRSSAANNLGVLYSKDMGNSGLLLMPFPDHEVSCRFSSGNRKIIK